MICFLPRSIFLFVFLSFGLFVYCVCCFCVLDMVLNFAIVVTRQPRREQRDIKVSQHVGCALRKHAHAINSNISWLPKNNFQMKNYLFFSFLQKKTLLWVNVRTASVPQSMFLSKHKKKVYPCKPQFYYIKVGCKGVFVTRTCFHDGLGSYLLRHSSKS